MRGGGRRWRVEKRRKGRSARVTVTLDRELWERLGVAAVREERSKAAIIRRCLRRCLVEGVNKR